MFVACTPANKKLERRISGFMIGPQSWRRRLGAAGGRGHPDGHGGGVCCSLLPSGEYGSKLLLGSILGDVLCVLYKDPTSSVMIQAAGEARRRPQCLEAMTGGGGGKQSVSVASVGRLEGRSL